MTRIAAGMCRLILRLAARVSIEVDGEIPRDGPLIVVANHISAADPPLVVGWLTPLLGRQMHILAKQALFVGPVGWFLRSQGVTPVRAGGSDMDAFRVARGVLDRREVLCIFPEGTRSATGMLAEAKPGVAMLATRTQVAILPVGISGSDQFLGRAKRMPRFRAPIRLHVGRTFMLTLDPTLSHRAAMSAASDELMRNIAALIDERHRGRFQPGPIWQHSASAKDAASAQHEAQED